MGNPPLNPISVRTPTFDLETPEGREAAHRYLASGVVDLNQAIAALHQKVVSQKPSTTNIFESIAGGSGGGQVVGGVNDQIGVTAYTTQQSDYGAKIIVGDALPITINLFSGVTTPWFTIIDNDSSSIASLNPTIPASITGDRYIDPGCFGIIYYDGANFWCGATRIATDSTFGYVEPDGVTIDIDSSAPGVIFTQIFANSGAPAFTPNTMGNPFYFDSSVSPWNGWVWYGNAWNRFS